MKTYQLMKLWLFAVAATTIFLIGSCEKIDYHQITDEEMQWLHYDNNEVLKFQNSSGDLVKYRTVLRLKAYIDRGVDTDEWTGAFITQVNDTDAISSTDSDGQLYIIKQKDGLHVYYSWPHFVFKEVPITNKPPSAVNIGGVNYTDIYVMDSKGYTSNRFYVNKVWVSRTKGVVQYEDMAGEMWLRDF